MRSVKEIRKNGQKSGELRFSVCSGKLSSTWGCGSEGERLTGSQKVAGSSPASSMLNFPATATNLLRIT